MENVSLRLVFILLLFANRARGESGNNGAPYKIIEIQRLSVARLEDRQIWMRQESGAEPVRFERVR